MCGCLCDALCVTVPLATHAYRCTRAHACWLQGSGKTFTMGTGSSKDVPRDQLGIVPRVVEDIFRTVKVAAAAA